MPDPRSVTFGVETIIGYEDGTATAFDEYGRRPWDENFKGEGGIRSGRLEHIPPLSG